MSLKINEIFYSIQGESLYAGLPCVFIRLTGCNLRCAYCDTRYAYDEGADMPLAEIIRRVEIYPRSSIVEITGGEPLLQDKTPDLIEQLLARHYTVLMETNGSLDISQTDRRCTKIMDIKCPSSRMHLFNDLNNLRRLEPKDQVKFVMGTRADYLYALEILSQLPPDYPKSHVLFSPVAGVLPPQTLAAWMLQDGSGARLHLQMHKIIWPEQERGV